MMKYCPHCGSRLTRQVIEAHERDYCPACASVYYDQWKVSAGVRIEKDGKLLLVQRGLDPWRGKWHLPAGFVEIDEEPNQAAIREAREETGLEVKTGRLVDCYPDSSDPRGKVIVLIYEAEIVAGLPVLSKETLAINYFSAEEIVGLPLAGMSAKNEIGDWLKEKVK